MGKALIVQEASRHKENFEYRECFAIQDGFLRNGWSADVWGLGHENFGIEPDFAAYDLIFILENYSFDWLPDWSKINTFKVQWVIDAHCADLTNYVNVSNRCDIVLHSTKCLIEDYQKYTTHQKHIWFPNGFNDQLFYNQNKVRDLDCIFVASNICGRDRIAKYVGADLKFALGDSMTDLISRSKVHFNKSISCDINYRCFETIALGAALVTNRVPDIEFLGFSHGENCMLYNTLDEAKSLIQNLLQDNQLLQKIQSGGLELSRRHSYYVRVKDFLKSLSLH